MNKVRTRETILVLESASPFSPRAHDIPLQRRIDLTPCITLSLSPKSRRRRISRSSSSFSLYNIHFLFCSVNFVLFYRMARIIAPPICNVHFFVFSRERAVSTSIFNARIIYASWVMPSFREEISTLEYNYTAAPQHLLFSPDISFLYIGHIIYYATFCFE